MDEEIIGLIRDRLDQLQETCEGVRDDIKEHARVDAEYWRKLDAQQGQLDLIKWVGGGLSLSGLMAWLFGTFGKH